MKRDDGARKRAGATVRVRVRCVERLSRRGGGVLMPQGGE